MESDPDPRDLVGYGEHPPHARWPNGARLALSFVLNFEEGAERSILHGDATSEDYLQEIPGKRALAGARDLGVESVYEYGARAGFWRIHRLLAGRGMSATVFAVGQALERNPAAARAMVDAGFEVAGHGWRWIDYREVPEAEEREHVRRTIAAIERATGRRPVGWYTGRVSPNTRRLLVEEGGFLYDSDSYADDLPYWVRVAGAPHLVVPYALDTNDMQFAGAGGFHGEGFSCYLRDAFDLLYAEGAERPRMLSIGLHGRLAGRPGRAAALARFLDHAARHERVWITTREAIARHWREQHPPVGV